MDMDIDHEPSSPSYAYNHNEHTRTHSPLGPGSAPTYGHYDTRPPALRYDTSTTIGGADADELQQQQQYQASQWDTFATGQYGQQRMQPRPYKAEETGLEGLMGTFGLKEPFAQQGSEQGGKGWKSWFKLA